MNKLISSPLSRVFRVRIDGTINQQMTNTIAEGLQKSWLYKPEALMLTINSPGGSLLQAKNISAILKHFSHQHNIPIYSFAEDQCLGSANLLLTAGVKSYAYSMSLIGDLGFLWSSLWLKKFAQKYQIKQELIHSGKNKVTFNPFEDLQPENQEWMKTYLSQLEQELRAIIFTNRNQHFSKLKLDRKAIDENLFQLGVIDSEVAVKFGLIDGIRSLDEELSYRFSSKKIREVTKKPINWAEQLRTSD